MILILPVVAGLLKDLVNLSLSEGMWALGTGAYVEMMSPVATLIGS